ncbi:disulfide bond formation protein DsbD, partial [Vibrio anguillarum]|nr:disulfide bond formation protein DsbD [Vibrio anguillarum]
MFTACFLSLAVRCQPLSRALCLISQNQSVVAFSLFLQPFVLVC